MESLNWVQGASSMSLTRMLDQSKGSDLGPRIYLVGRLMNVGSIYGVRIRPKKPVTWLHNECRFILWGLKWAQEST